MSVTMEECRKNKRTLSDMQTCCSKKTVDDRKGCVSKPLLEFEPEFIIVDELHMLLRISDRLINSLVLRMAQLDNAECARGSHCHSSNHMNQIVAAIRSCGVHFRESLVGHFNTCIFSYMYM